MFKASTEYTPLLILIDQILNFFFLSLNIFIDFFLSVRADFTFAASGLNVILYQIDFFQNMNYTI